MEKNMKKSLGLRPDEAHRMIILILGVEFVTFYEIINHEKQKRFYRKKKT